MKSKPTHEQIIIYQSKDKNIELDVTIDQESVWLTQAQMTKLFGRERTVITKHINNVFKDGELAEKSNVQNMHLANSDKPVKAYNLDVVISVGYRVKSLEGTRFRQWATKTLKNHILKGYTINQSRIQKNYNQFLKAVDDVKSLLPKDFLIDKDGVLDLITLFADTWLSLDAYDKDELVAQGATKKKVSLTAEKLNNALMELKQNIISKNEASNLFGIEREKNSVVGIIGNVMQSFAEQELYTSVEEKAAHLFYFIIKNHPFVDGNKRSGAYAFVWFLRQAKILDTTKITPPALTAIALLVAESSPKDKEKMIGLICAFLGKNKT